LKEKIEQLKVEEQVAERKGDLQRVAEIRYSLIRQAEQELASLTAQIEKSGGERMLKEEVDEEDIARIVSRWTGIPVSRCSRARSRSWSRWKSACASAWWGKIWH
jgi:ATP-dependent Clp protease ATP-binding subunit ClpB